MSEFDTPTGMKEPKPDGVPDWFIWQFATLQGVIKSINTKVTSLCDEMVGVRNFMRTTEGRLERGSAKFEAHDKRLIGLEKFAVPSNLGRGNPKSKSNDNEKVSYKWLLEWVIRAALLLGGWALGEFL